MMKLGFCHLSFVWTICSICNIWIFTEPLPNLKYLKKIIPKLQYINLGVITMSDVESAVQLFEGTCNCAQAILVTYGTKFGITKAQALQLGTGFGGGLARHGEVCGAVSGAIMVIGLKFGMVNQDNTEARTKTYEVITQFIDKYNEHQRSILCRELLGCDISTPGGREFASEKELFSTKCPEFVREAAIIMEELLQNDY
jgi:C_GCAxxG_C_C family probable redox protein